MSTPEERRRRYREYLRSPHWQAKRARILARAQDLCERCGRFCGLNPHGPHLEDELSACHDASCAFCACYFEEDGQRNDAELQMLEIHHLTYERRGQEADSDLEALCWACHEETWDEDRRK